MYQIHEIAPFVKEELLDIYQAFAEVCITHRLKHWVAYGTMLGAVRHHGFIPWDDDFDVFMMRDDYETFFTIAEEKLPSHYKPVTYHNCKVYPATFGKIQESRHEVYAKIQKECGYVNPHGLYIDIFPLDGCPNGWFAQKMDTIRQGALFCMDSHCFRSSGHSTIKGKIADVIGKILKPFYPSLKTKNDFAQKADCIYYRKYHILPEFLRRGDYEAHFQRAELKLPSFAFRETSIVPFEHITVPIPKDYNACLTAMYGNDYMTPPPPEKRISEHSKQDIAPWLYGPC